MIFLKCGYNVTASYLIHKMPHYGIKSTAGHHHLRVVCAPKFNRTEGQSKISGNKNPVGSEKS